MFNDISTVLVKNRISFSGKERNVFDNNAIPELQCKGVTALCRILNERQFAYLADEVGMGKTYQALGVASMLLAEKNDARILIIAPNEAVQRNWITEIKNFKSKNLLCDIPMEVFSDHPIEVIRTFKKGELQAGINIVRLTAFSTIGEHVASRGNKDRGTSISIDELANGLANVVGEDKVTVQNKLVYSGNMNTTEAGLACGIFLRKYSPLYDLVIVDEAQNIRNENNATLFFDSWMGLKRFGKKGKADTVTERKYLLISATPAHRGVESLKRQLLYFMDKEDIPSTLDHGFLENFLIRRLRTYNGDSKYEVRKVHAEDVINYSGDERNTEQRLFLALIQSRLAQLQEDGRNNASFKIGFLETFESYEATLNVSEDGETGEKNKEFENGGSQNVYEKGIAPDKKMLMQLAKSYEERFSGEYVPHPKFGYMENEIRKLLSSNIYGNGSTPDKAIVFVRRLASVEELVKRLNSLYEAELLKKWGKTLKTTTKLENIQYEFQRLYNKQITQDEEDAPAEDIKDELLEENEIKSKFLSWLALKKYDKDYKYNAVSLFKKSMVRNKTRSYLFEENYYRTACGERGYEKKIEELVNREFVRRLCLYIKADEKRYISHYSGKKKYNTSDLLILCCYLAFEIDNHAMADSLRDFYNIRIPDEVEYCEDLIDINTVKKILLQTSIWNYIIQDKRIEGWPKEETFEKQYMLKSWIEKYLKSSEAILEILYCVCQIKADKHMLCREIINRLFGKSNAYLGRINQLIDNRELVYNQLLSGEKFDYKYDPAFMNVQQWVMPAVGGNKGNEALIKRFNTPFYPDIIVCTDVLKEGINLHLFCNRVYHYGLAWTPGDLEQRIGRIDRFFSKTYRDRIQKKDSHIEVFYPFMGKSIDEHQLRKVLQFKLSADPLMDSSGDNRKDIEVVSDELMSIDELAEYTPSQIQRTNYPYSGERFWKFENKRTGELHD